MPHRRILSLWFPRLGAERLVRRAGLAQGPVAIVRDVGNLQQLDSLTAEASAEGLTPGQPLRDALAMCPALITRVYNPLAEAEFLAALRRWAGKYSPWVSDEPPASLVIDLTGCAHLFGGEAALLEEIEGDCAALGLSVHAGIADTVGAAWALARFADQPLQMARTGDAVDQEARATRARAVKRRNWERGGPPPALQVPRGTGTRIAPPGKTHSAIAALPVAALRLPEDALTGLARLGLRQVGDLTGMPRAALARRFGQKVVERLDQALGTVPEPVSPARPPLNFALRLTLPEPIGLESDILAALDRLLPLLAEKLRSAGRGARQVQLQLYRADQSMQWFSVGLARPAADPDRIRPLLAMKLGDVDAGFGIDMVRIEATVTEPVHARQHRGHLEAAADASARLNGQAPLDDLIGKIGARIGLEAITRRHPADSHIPEKTAKVLAAAWSEPAQGDWPRPPAPRPLLLWRPEPVTTDDPPGPPVRFRWRRRDLISHSVTGPERISPEWWLDDPEWRSGVRDYWRVTTTTGERLWLFYAHGGAKSAGWFCQGAFA
ncbi:MAG: DNA polymerase Y family protein [Paracoccaceae bacterium]|nr:DNA polymerase Y family protein [Paracoccaceae bacterium]